MTRLHRALRGKTAGDSAWALGEQVMSLLSTTISAVLLTKRLGDIGYGAFAAVYNLMGPFLAFIQSGVMLAVLDRIIRERKDPQQVAQAYLGYVWTVGTALGITVSLLAASFIRALPVTAAVLFIGTEFCVLSGMWVTTATIQATRGFKSASQVRLITTVVRTTIMITLAVIGKLDLTWFPLVQASAFVVLALIVHRWQERLFGARLRPGRFSRSDVKSSGVYGVGLSAIGIQTAYDQVIMSGKYRADAGRYAAAYRIVSLGLMPLNAIAAATHMDFLSVDDDHNDQITKARRFALLGIVYSVVFIGGVWVAAPLVPKILGEKFEGTVTMMRLLAPLVPLRGISTFPMNGLLGLGRNRLRTQILITSAIFSLVLYFALIPRYSWKGGVIGTLISESVLFAAAWIALFRCQATQNRKHDPITVG